MPSVVRLNVVALPPANFFKFSGYLDQEMGKKFWRKLGPIWRSDFYKICCLVILLGWQTDRKTDKQTGREIGKQTGECHDIR